MKKKILLLIVISVVLLGSIIAIKYDSKSSDEQIISFLVDGVEKDEMPDMTSHLFSGYECNTADAALLWNKEEKKLEMINIVSKTSCIAKFIKNEKNDNEEIILLDNEKYVQYIKGNKDDTIILPNLVKDGYTFIGWYDTMGRLVESGKTKIGDIPNQTVYASFVANNIVIYFNANGGTVSLKQKSVIYNETYGELPVPEKKNYKFIGWFTEANNGVERKKDDIVTVTKNETLFAHWQEISESHEETKEMVTISFETTFGTAPNSITVESGSNFNLPSIVGDQNHIFKGWKNKDGATVTNETKWTETQSLTAIWEIKEQTSGPTCYVKGKNDFEGYYENGILTECYYTKIDDNGVVGYATPGNGIKCSEFTYNEYKYDKLYACTAQATYNSYFLGAYGNNIFPAIYACKNTSLNTSNSEGSSGSTSNSSSSAMVPVGGGGLLNNFQNDYSCEEDPNATRPD